MWKIKFKSTLEPSHYSRSRRQRHRITAAGASVRTTTEPRAWTAPSLSLHKLVGDKETQEGGRVQTFCARCKALSGELIQTDWTDGAGLPTWPRLTRSPRNGSV
ncbi:unnamed protein product [Ixodes pacificus]